MRRILPMIIFGVLTASLAFAGSTMVTKIDLQSGKSVEGGIAVNPVTHKAYVIAELSTEGADDEKVVFVLDENVLTQTRLGSKKLSLTPSPTITPLRFIHIANENEYIAVDSTRNLIYVGTKFSVEQDESDSGDDSGSDEAGADAVDTPESDAGTGAQVGAVLAGTLTVIDGNTDSVIATWLFDPGIEPEGVAIDPATGVVYLAAKAPEGEANTDDVCSSGTPIYDVGEPGDVECWTAGHIYAFLVDRAANPIIKLLKDIPAGDDPESIAFQNGMIYAANEDDGTVTVASAVYPDGTGGSLVTDFPLPPAQPYSLGIAPYSLGVFYNYGPNPLACVENKFEADKMAAGGGSVFLTDDRSRVAKITGTAIMGMLNIPGATVCEAIPNSDGGGANSANNVAFMPRSDGGLLYVVSEQNTVAVINPATMTQKTTIMVPGAQHLDGIAVDSVANRVWLTDENLQAVFVLQGACTNGTGMCAP
jgi:DNA-binding beta-propeller fold protein YncE